MDILKPTLLAAVARAAGFPESTIRTAVCVALAESAGRIRAVNTTGNHPASRDRGLWQINDHYHPEVSDAAAFDPLNCARAARRISRGGAQWTEWSTWNSGAALRQIRRAEAAGKDPNGHDVYVYGLVKLGATGVIANTVRATLGVANRSGALLPGEVDVLKGAQRLTGLAPDGVVGPLTCARWGWHWVGHS